MPAAGIDAHRVEELRAREDRRFLEERPRSATLFERARRSMPSGVPMSWMADMYSPGVTFVKEGRGAYFTDVDGHTYYDVNIADTSMFCGFAPEPIVEAVARQMRSGNQFLMPGEDSIWVAEELARRYPVPKWQFTLSASQANTDAIRVARAATGRERVLTFEGKYHGMVDELLTTIEDGEPAPEFVGLARDSYAGTALVHFNDAPALEKALAGEHIACVITEPAMTNNQGLIMPEPGFHETLREATRRTGTLLLLDETHTQICGPGGLTRIWGLEPDIVTIGKSAAGGVPFGAFGMDEEVAAVMEDPGRAGGAHGTASTVIGGMATGGTLYANTLSMAAARAALEHVLTDQAYDRTAALGARLQDGIQSAIRGARLPWSVHRLFPRSGYTFAPDLPRDAAQARAVSDSDLTHLIRAYLANRGVWEAIEGAGPAVSVPSGREDVALYLGAFGELLAELTR